MAEKIRLQKMIADCGEDYAEKYRRVFIAYADMIYSMFKDEFPNGKHVLNLMIEPAFWDRKRIFFRLYQANDSNMTLLWNCASRDEVGDYEFSEYIKNFSPLHYASLSSEQQELVNAVLAENFPIDVDYPQVYDGFEFVLKLCDGEERTYTSCCYLPEEWHIMVPMINMFIDLANVRYQHHVF